jgi:hypothetical protein
VDQSASLKCAPSSKLEYEDKLRAAHTSDRARGRGGDVPMILNRLTLERKSPTGAYGALCEGWGFCEVLMALKPSWLCPLVPLADVPFEWPFEVAASQVAHMIAIDCR